MDRKEEGLALAVTLRVVGLTLWAAILAYLINPALMHWASVPLPDWLRWMGIVAGVACWWLMYWTLSNLGKNLTDTVVRRTGATLITSGPYRWIRHPFYTTVALQLLTATLLAANWAFGLLSLMVMALLVRHRQGGRKTRRGFCRLSTVHGHDWAICSEIDRKA